MFLKSNLLHQNSSVQQAPQDTSLERIFRSVLVTIPAEPEYDHLPHQNRQTVLREKTPIYVIILKSDIKTIPITLFFSQIEITIKTVFSH